VPPAAVSSSPPEAIDFTPNSMPPEAMISVPPAGIIVGITPHLGGALQLRRTFVRLGVKVDALVETIDRLAAGIIVLGSEGGEIHVNSAAREIAARNDGLWLDRTGALHAAERGADRALMRICADVRAGGAGGIVRVPRRGGAALCRSGGAAAGRRRDRRH
jgi:hypothetical protein